MRWDRDLCLDPRQTGGRRRLAAAEDCRHAWSGFSSWSSARRKNAAYYDAAFADVEGVRTPTIDPANESIYNQYTPRVARREDLQAHLRAKGIGSAIYYPLSLHLQPCFEYLGYKRGAYPESEKATKEVISLPVYPELKQSQLDEVIEAVRGFYGR